MRLAKNVKPSSCRSSICELTNGNVEKLFRNNLKRFKHFMLALLLFTAFITSGRASGSGATFSANVTLVWNPSTNKIVAGFNLYYGSVSGAYTNKTSAGMATSLTISNLIPGTAYYFAATTYSAAGAESALSSEVSYTVPMPSSGVQLIVTTSKQFILTVTGPVGQSYDIQATQDFIAWTVIGTVTVGANGSFAFTDTNAAGFSQRFYRTHEITP
jgi:hypothetical protein